MYRIPNTEFVYICNYSQYYDIIKKELVISDFSKLRLEFDIYVDKSLFIQKIIDIILDPGGKFHD